jgi:hypothetical protein
MAQGEQLARFYPGLKPAEAALWRLWLRDHEVEFDRFEYNVLVGKGQVVEPAGVEPGSPLAQNLKAMWQKLTQRKIDVVAWAGPEPWIIEVKELPGPAILGQLVTYETWFVLQRNLKLEPQLAVVCYRVGTDMMEALADNAVTVYELVGVPGVVPPAGVVPPV